MKIGIIGGGQLGYMMTDAIHKLGHEAYVLEPSANCCCKQNADFLLVKPYNDIDALAAMVDVITFEFENVSEEALEKHLSKVPQGVNALHITKNRIREKSHAVSIGIKTPRFERVYNDLDEKIKIIGFPAILKTTSEGYDGKGQYVLKNVDDLPSIRNQEFILEEKIDFDYEISVIVVRNINGEIITFPIPKNIHKNGILHLSIANNDIPKNIQDKAKNAAIRFMEKSDFYGIVAIELFVKDNEVYFNEYAPRPHNSGHWTIEACEMNQFDASIMAILGVPFGSSELKHKALMVNILGQDVETPIVKNERPQKYIHMYPKDEKRENRKMGHITYIDYSDDVFEEINESVIR